MTAEEAKIIANKKNGDFDTIYYKFIIDEIKSQALKGEYSAIFNCGFSKQMSMHIEKLGYKIITGFDRNEYWTKISWG